MIVRGADVLTKMFKSQKLPLVYWFSLTGSLIVILIQILRWEIADILTWLEPFIEVVLYLFFLIVFMWSLVYWIRNKKENPRASISLFINLFALLIVIIIPFNTIVLGLGFQLNYQKRATVVKMIEEGKLEEDTSGDILLPKEYRGLSKGGGRIYVEKYGETTAILFLTYRGLMENFSGYIYRSDNKQPDQNDFGGNFVKIIKLKDNWFWAVSGD